MEYSGYQATMGPLRLGLSERSKASIGVVEESSSLRRREAELWSRHKRWALSNATYSILFIPSGIL